MQIETSCSCEEPSTQAVVALSRLVSAFTCKNIVVMQEQRLLSLNGGNTIDDDCKWKFKSEKEKETSREVEQLINDRKGAREAQQEWGTINSSPLVRAARQAISLLRPFLCITS